MWTFYFYLVLATIIVLYKEHKWILLHGSPEYWILIGHSKRSAGNNDKLHKLTFKSKTPG